MGIISLVILNADELHQIISRPRSSSDAQVLQQDTLTPLVQETKVLATWYKDDNSTIEDMLRVKEKSWNRAIHEAKQVLAEKQSNAECLRPNIKNSMELLQHFTDHPPPTPILNMGFPKCGSSSLFDYFKCTGYRATHWLTNTDHFEGVCMRDAVAVGEPPLHFCSRGNEAILQMDVEFPLQDHKVSKVAQSFRDECYFPQMSILEEIHKEVPHATFILNFRPIEDWIKSIFNWKLDMMDRFQKCNLPNLPRGIPRNLTDKVQLRTTMLEFWCSHITHVRNFVKDHPSHALIELDLYDSNTSSYIMSELFPKRPSAPGGQHGSARSCWGQSNANPKIGGHHY
jgi:hypothetical protein